MSTLISKWFTATIDQSSDDQNSAEVDLLDAFEAIEIDIPTIDTAEVQIKGSNSSGGTFDKIGYEEPIPSSTGGFRTTVTIGGQYQFIKVYTSAAQSSDRTFYVRGIRYASGGIVGLLDRLKTLLSSLTLGAGTSTIGKVGHDKSGIGHGVKTVTTAGTHEALASSTTAKVVIIQAQTDNTGAIAVGGDEVDATVATGTGILLYAGDTITLEIDDLADVYVDATVNGEGVRYTYLT